MICWSDQVELLIVQLLKLLKIFKLVSSWSLSSITFLSSQYLCSGIFESSLHCCNGYSNQWSNPSCIHTSFLSNNSFIQTETITLAMSEWADTLTQMKQLPLLKPLQGRDQVAGSHYLHTWLMSQLKIGALSFCMPSLTMLWVKFTDITACFEVISPVYIQLKPIDFAVLSESTASKCLLYN